MKALLPTILLFVLVGCASVPSRQAKADSRVRPFISALEAYHRDTGDYPQQLDELRPQYVRADIPLHDNTDAKDVWYCFYDRVDRNHYSLRLYSSPCSEAVYNNGKFIAAYGPAFK